MDLTDKRIQDTYGGIMNIGAQGYTGGTYTVTDGFGNALPIQIGQDAVTFSVQTAQTVIPPGPYNNDDEFYAANPGATAGDQYLLKIGEGIFVPPPVVPVYAGFNPAP